MEKLNLVAVDFIWGRLWSKYVFFPYIEYLYSHIEINRANLLVLLVSGHRGEVHARNRACCQLGPIYIFLRDLDFRPIRVLFRTWWCNIWSKFGGPEVQLDCSAPRVCCW